MALRCIRPLFLVYGPEWIIKLFSGVINSEKLWQGVYWKLLMFEDRLRQSHAQKECKCFEGSTLLVWKRIIKSRCLMDVCVLLDLTNNSTYYNSYSRRYVTSQFAPWRAITCSST